MKTKAEQARTRVYVAQLEPVITFDLPYPRGSSHVDMPREEKVAILSW